MCSLARRDARKGVILGFDLPRQMDDDDLPINPDTDLSYIDEKIESVLGHFQKDFEGDVTQEKLGAVYGGYGSFLPMYQRSPPCSHPRSALRAQNIIAPSSPKKLQVEDGYLKSAATSSVSHVKCDLDSDKSVPPPALVLPSATISAKEDLRKPVKSVVIPKTLDQKSLKVTLKVGSANLSARKNAEIYSGLGLVMSPSSSLDESPAERDDFCHVPQVPYESPTSILQMMKSFPVHGESLLSPLSDELLNLAERPVKSKSLCNGSRDIPNNIDKGHAFVKNAGKDLVNKKTTMVSKNCFLHKMENGSKNGVTCKKESDINELKSNTLKLPMLANSFCSTGGRDASFGGANRDLREEKKNSDLKKENLLEPIPQNHGQVEKLIPKPVSAKKVNSDHIKADSNATKEGKLPGTERLGPAKLNQEVAFHEQGDFDGDDGKELLTSRGKKKLKVSQYGILDPDLPTGNLRVDSPTFAKKKKASNPNDLHKKKQNIFRKPCEQFKGIKFEEDDKEINCLKKSTVGRIESESVLLNDVSKDKFGGKNISKMKTFLEVASNVVPMSGNEHTLDAVDWVQCEKCEKWRILPIGINVTHISKWDCSMLNWLPGMNSCSVSDDETNNMVTELNQNLVPGSHFIMSCNGLEAVMSADVAIIDQNHQNSAASVPNIGKKKRKLKEFSSGTSHDVHSQISNSSLENLPEVAHVSKSFRSPTEKHEYKQRENYVTSEQFSHGGDNKKVKLKTKAIGRVCSDSGLQNHPKYKECLPSKDLKCGPNANLLVSVRKQNKQAPVPVDDKLAGKVKLDISGFSKKRKEIDFHLPKYEKGLLKEEAGGNKKMKLQKCDGRENGATKSNGFVDKKIDCVNNSKISVVANSSSSKVSGSHKTKASFQELKVSPVGSVSSSPFIKSNPDVSTSTKKNFDRKLDSRGCSDGEGKKGSFQTNFRMGSSQSMGNEYCKIPIADSAKKQQDCTLKDRTREGKKIIHEKIPSSSDKVGRIGDGRTGKLKSESWRGESQSRFDGNDGPDMKLGNCFSKNAASSLDQNQAVDDAIDRISKRTHSEKSDRAVVVPERGNLPHLPPSGKAQQINSGPQKRVGPDLLPPGASDGHDGLPPKVNIMTDLRQPIPNGIRNKNIDARNPVRKDCTIYAEYNGLLNEAQSLKHMADRNKNTESNLENTRLYFEAALKFMHAAFVLESDLLRSLDLYSSTAGFCKYCAQEYEKIEDMAAAALAYKCMEVAYMKATYLSHGTADRERHELHLALNASFPGESPSSSASDVDNLNNPPTAEKLALVKKTSCSPHVATNLVITPRNKENMSRLLTFAKYSYMAMEASRKSHIAFAAAKPILEGSEYKDAVSSIKAALDYNFHDVEGLLRLIRLALETFTNG